MRQLWILILAAIGCWPGEGLAQPLVDQALLYGVRYRPPDVTYRVGTYPHFRMIYQTGTEPAAFAMGRVLEATLVRTTALVGLTGHRLQMPVVVNGYSDNANGFVSPLPFRQEIDAVSIKSDALTTYFASWPEAVATHELVHAAQADLNAGPGVGGFVRLFAPDWSRVINLTAPAGLLEGIAVYRESQLHPRAGRLHTPVATMAYRAAMLSDDPWSLTQMLEAPSYTRPFDRHYLGGGQLVQHLIRRDGTPDATFFHEATRLHHRFPFLGFGVTLWHGTGQPPWALGDSIQQALIGRAHAEQQARRPFTPVRRIASAPGLMHRRPYWLDDSTLVAHVRGYNVTPGFYAIDAATGRQHLLSAQRVTEAYTYQLGRDTSALYFARYVADPWVPGRARADVHRLSLRSGEVRRLTQGARVLGPAPGPRGQLWALQNDGPYNHWSVIRPDGSVQPLLDVPQARFEQIAASPEGRAVAVLLNIDGEQRLYRAEHVATGAPRLVPWLGFAGAAIYDISWGPKGRYLLFAADPSGVANIYALDTQADQVLRLTNVPFGALEPALSPDRTTVAFANYRHERFDLARMPFRPDAAPVIDAARILRGGEEGWTGPAALRKASSPLPSRPASTAPYEPLDHLRPRIVVPTFDYDPDRVLGARAGVVLAGSDPLQTGAYRGEVFYQAERLWGEATVQSGAYLLRPAVTVFDRPYALGAGGVEERGIELTLGAPLTLEANAHLTQLQFQADAAWRQTRIIDAEGHALTDFGTRLTVQPAAAFGYRLQANPRDLAPGAGLLVRAAAEVDAWTRGVAASRALLLSARAYLPLFRASNTSLSVQAGFFTQNRGSVFDPARLVPRGFEDDRLPGGSYGQLGLDVVHPLLFVDDGLTIVPFYLKALYAYGFAETLQPLSGAGRPRSAIGGGLGMQFRFFYQLDVDLRVGFAYHPGQATTGWVWQ